MNKYMYLLMRSSGSMDILYEYYKDHYDKERHSRFLHPQEFGSALQSWNMMGLPMMMQKAVDYFDIKHGVTKLLDKEGNLIRVL